MSLVDKIPALISAIAFGYGVGMAAPDSTLQAVEKGLPHGAGATPPRRLAVAAADPGESDPLARPISARESTELARLRSLRAPEVRVQGGSCDLDEPMFSRGDREGSASLEMDEIDETGREALSRLQLPDMGMSVTRQALKYVRFFARTDRGRGMYETWLKRSGRYIDMIQEELRRRNLPEDLLWVAMIESGFDPVARSPAGAVGLWQFMPATGRVYGLKQSTHVDQRRNARLATEAAAHHLRDLHARFGHWDLALAAYNMGYEQLLDRIDRYGTSDFSELVRQGALPSETAKYVPKIAAAAIIANNLERFGFENIKQSAPVDSSEITVPPRTPLKLVARACGVPTSTIRNLNPDFLTQLVPPGKGDHIVLIPPDAMSRARAALPSMLENASFAKDDAEVLDPVDMLGSGPSAGAGRDVDDDASLLPYLPPPKKRRSLRDVLPEEDVDGDGRRDVVAVDDTLVDEQPFRKGRETIVHRVGAGESLVSVARQYATDVDDVAKLNGMKAKEKLKEGALLKVRVHRDILEEIGGDKGSDKGSDKGKKDEPSEGRAGGREETRSAKRKSSK